MQKQKALIPVAALTLTFAGLALSSNHDNVTSFSAYSSAPAPLTAPAIDGGNYLSEVGESNYSVWPAAQLPLKVFIQDGSGVEGYRESYPEFMRSAFNEWQNLSNQRITWREVTNPAEADIICSWTAEVTPRGIGVEAGQTQTIIQRNYFTGAGRIVSARIKVLTSANGQTFNDADAYKTCLHEVGHALGLQGHSSTASDIMYPVLNRRQTPYLKQRDVNTIAALYQPRETYTALARPDQHAPRQVRVRFSDLSPAQQQAVRVMLERMGLIH